VLQLIRRWPAKSGQSDRGAVATLVAILLAGGVLLGMAALAVDVGRLYAEREELQSGADAAAMAVAKLCAEKPANCAGGSAAIAAHYADENAKDNASGVSAICGDMNGALPACPAPADNLTACLNDPPDSEYVEVRTSTELPGGSTLLPPTFAQALVGNEGYSGTRVAACARASFGAPIPAKGIALTISVCEWDALTGGGTTFPAAPPYPPNPLPPTSAEKASYLHSTAKAKTCPAGPSGWDKPGGFGWLDEEGGPCEALVGDDGTVGGNTGNSASGTCQDLLEDYYNNPRVLFIPVYDGVLGTGSNTTYHIKGMAAFVLTGYSLPSNREKSWLSGKHLCNASESCLYGFFTQALIPVPGPIGGPDLGARIVTLIG